MMESDHARSTAGLRRAVIPAAGLGTRLWPASRAVPKEMLPVQLRPMIEYSVAEAALSGIREICVIVAPEKQALVRSYFHAVPPRDATIEYVVQPKPLGLMEAVHRAAAFTRGEPFALLLPDNIFVGPPALAQLIEVWAEHRTDVVGLIQPSSDEIPALGPRAPLSLAPFEDEGTFRVTAVGLQKHPLQSVRGRRSTTNVGRYIFGADVFAQIEAVEGRAGSEELDDVPVLSELARRGRLIGRIIEGEHYDVGNPLGYWRANRRFDPADDLVARLVLPAVQR